MQVHIDRNGERYGPYSIEDINAYLANGTLLPTDLAWQDGMTDWLPVSQISGVVMPGGSVAASIPASQSVSTGSKRKVLIGVGVGMGLLALMAGIWFFFIHEGGEYDNSPAGLLKKIHSLAQKEDYDKLKDCIFPFSDQVRRRVAALPSHLIKGIKEKKIGGDFAYTHKALKTLTDNHLDKLKPAADWFLKECMPDGDFGEDERIAKIAKTRPQDITMFDFERVHILIIKFEGEHKLIFWENLTDLSGERQKEELSENNENKSAAEKPVKELTAEEKKVVGEYERKKGETSRKLVLLENRKIETYKNGEKRLDGTWKISGKEVHVDAEKNSTWVYKIEPNGDITWIAEIKGGKRDNDSKDEQPTLKKIK